ncbi:MAG: hypothetical protein Q8P67_19005 [archaeon]|nr:hypothetical protein [archaeon]
MSDLDDPILDELHGSVAEEVPTPEVFFAEPVVEPVPVSIIPSPQAAPLQPSPAPTAVVVTPTKAVSKPVKPAATPPKKAATPAKKSSASPAKHMTADSILVTGRDDKVHPNGPPVSKYTKEQIEDRVRARNRAKAHNDAAKGLASGETVFDRIAVKDSPVKAEKPAASATPSPQKGDYNILVTGRDSKIHVTAKSPSKYTKEQIEDRVRARNRAKAHNDAAKGLASGETVFDRIAVKDSPSKQPSSGPSTPKKDANLLTTSRDDKIKAASSAHSPSDIEAKAKARAKAITKASTKGGAGASGDILERMFQDGIHKDDSPASST